MRSEQILCTVVRAVSLIDLKTHGHCVSSFSEYVQWPDDEATLKSEMAPKNFLPRPTLATLTLHIKVRAHRTTFVLFLFRCLAGKVRQRNLRGARHGPRVHGAQDSSTPEPPFAGMFRVPQHNLAASLPWKPPGKEC